MRNCILLFFCGFLSLSTPSGAQSGYSAYGFLDYPLASHANALGGTNISVVGRDLSMVTQNPALLGPELSDQLVLGFTHLQAGINHGNVLYANQLGTRGAWAAGVQYVDYGTFQETTADNQIIGSFGAKDMAFSAQVGYDITTRIRGGVTTRFLYSHYESYSALALGVDIGFNYYNEETDFSLACVARNLGGQLKPFDEIRESLPFSLDLGFSRSLRHAPFRFSVTAVDLTHWKSKVRRNSDTETTANQTEKNNFAKDLFRHLVFGIDYLPTEQFYLALGYNYKRRDDFSEGGGFLTGLSGGAGIRIRMFDINASVAKYHRSGTSLMVGVTLLLNKF